MLAENPGPVLPGDQADHLVVLNARHIPRSLIGFGGLTGFQQQRRQVHVAAKRLRPFPRSYAKHFLPATLNPVAGLLYEPLEHVVKRPLRSECRSSDAEDKATRPGSADADIERLHRLFSIVRRGCPQGTRLQT